MVAFLFLLFLPIIALIAVITMIGVVVVDTIYDVGKSLHKGEVPVNKYRVNKEKVGV